MPLQQPTSDSIRQPPLFPATPRAPSTQTVINRKLAANTTFSNADVLLEILKKHPKTKPFFSERSRPVDAVVKRQKAIYVASKLAIDEFGNYPTTEQKLHIASLLGCLLDLPPAVIFDQEHHTGYLPCALDNRRRQLDAPAKKFTWKRKMLSSSRPSDTDVEPAFGVTQEGLCILVQRTIVTV